MLVHVDIDIVLSMVVDSSTLTIDIVHVDIVEIVDTDMLTLT